MGACALWCLVMDGSVGGDGWSRLAQGGTRQGAPARPRCSADRGGFLHLNVQRNSGGRLGGLRGPFAGVQHNSAGVQTPCKRCIFAL